MRLVYSEHSCLFSICAGLELFCDFLQFDRLHKRLAFYDMLATDQKRSFFKVN